MSAIDGELFVPMRPSEYGVQANDGGNIYTTRDGLSTEANAREFGKALETVVGKDYVVVPILTVRVEAKRGRKSGASKADSNGQPATASATPAQTPAGASAPKTPAAVGSGSKS